MKAKSTTKIPNKRKNVLLVIALLFISSAAFRMPQGTGYAWAQVSEMTSSMSYPTNHNTSATDLSGVLEALQAREDRVTLREKQIYERMEAMEKAELELAEKLDSLIQAEERLKATIAMASTAAEDDIARLISIYESMKPKDAALIFEEMDSEFAAGVLSRMDPDIAARIIAGLSSEIAHAISITIAGRNIVTKVEQ
jgi:flagellar motility protein MotE (MotC chaperone)